MDRQFKHFTTLAWLAAIPAGGCLIGIGSADSDLQLPRLGVQQAFSGETDLNPRKFRFRIPRASELPELIPRYAFLKKKRCGGSIVSAENADNAVSDRDRMPVIAADAAGTSI